MFRGKIVLTGVSVADLPWSEANRTSYGSELRPYLVSATDREERKKVRCEENPQVNLSLFTPLTGEVELSSLTIFPGPASNHQS